MTMRGVSRRDILKTLAMGAVGGSVLQVIPAEAAEFAHQMVHKEKAASAARSLGGWSTGIHRFAHE
jgi:hypothetical protein